MTRPREKILPTVRIRVYIRAKWRCEYCGLRFREGKFGKAPMRELGMFLELDHIEPHSLGGADHPKNFRAACSRCNRSRGVDPDDTWAQRLEAHSGT